MSGIKTTMSKAPKIGARPKKTKINKNVKFYDAAALFGVACRGYLICPSPDCPLVARLVQAANLRQHETQTKRNGHDLEIRRSRDLEIWRSRDLEIWKIMTPAHDPKHGRRRGGTPV